MTLDLNNWCIDVEEEVIGIDVSNMRDIRFKLDIQTFDMPLIPELCSMPPPAATPKSRAHPSLSLDPSPMPTTPTMCTGRTQKQPLAYLMFPNGFGLCDLISLYKGVG